jgi:hypothetical protein
MGNSIPRQTSQGVQKLKLINHEGHEGHEAQMGTPQEDPSLLHFFTVTWAGMNREGMNHEEHEGHEA